MTIEPPYDVAVFGGGIAGLSAAVDLSAAGCRVVLAEQRQRLGGRTYSYIDEETGDTVDNGQHLLMGCYHATRGYLNAIGSSPLARLQPRLRMEFLHRGGRRSTLSCPDLPAPFHIGAGVIGLTAVSLADRMRLVRVGLDILTTSPEKERRLEQWTVDEWLTRLGQSAENKKYLWDIIAIGSLNDDTTRVSALLFFRVLRAAFLGSKENSSLLVPRVGLSELLVDPAERMLKQYGCTILKGNGVAAWAFDGTGVSGAVLDDGSTISARAYVCALPWYAAAEGIPSLQGMAFESSPIVTVNLWLDRPVTDLEMAALPDGRFQWLFNRSLLLGGRCDGGQYLSMVISGASTYVDDDKDKLVELAMEDLRNALPEAAAAKVVHAVVIKEKRATYSPRPGTEARRPGSVTAYENLFLAGDWTSTGLPATIEGAVMSGQKAAGFALEYLQRGVRPAAGVVPGQ